MRSRNCLKGVNEMWTKLLPAPKEVVSRPGELDPAEISSIALSVHSAELEYEAARQLQQTLGIACRKRTPVEKRYAVRTKATSIVLGVVERDAALFGQAHERLASALGVSGNAEDYVLAVEEDGVFVLGRTPTGVYAGVQSLRQGLDIARMTGQAHGGRLACVQIKDGPRLAFRGVLLDVTRGKVPTLDTLMRLVDILSYFKVNVLQLYMEHTYDFPSHPAIGEGTGALSCDDILALDERCRKRNVELIPYFSSFAHMYRITHLPQYEHLGEGPEFDNISPAVPETYKLLEDLYDELLPAFSSERFNAGCDETQNLGKGRSRELVESLGYEQVYAQHIRRIHELVEKKYNRRLMIWGDMILAYPRILELLPEPLTLLNWNYEARERYDQVDKLAQAGHEQWVCPGTSSWNTIFPRINTSRRNIAGMIRRGIEAGAKGALNTDWGDGGHPNPLGNSWYGYLFGADQSWGYGDEESFDGRFSLLFAGDPEGNVGRFVRRLGDAVEYGPFFRPNGTLTNRLFYRELDEALLSRFSPGDIDAFDRMRGEAEELLSVVEQSSLSTPGHSPAAGDEVALTLAEWRTAERQLALCSLRARWHLDGAPAGETAARLERGYKSLRRAFESEWKARNRAEGLEQNLRLFDDRIAEFAARR